MIALRSKQLDLPDDIEAVYARFEADGFGDGHPVIPPTPERVERFLARCDLDPAAEVVTLEPASGVGTVEKVAINAVMAGCLPEHMDVVIAALPVYFPHGAGPFMKRIERHWRNSP